MRCRWPALSDTVNYEFEPVWKQELWWLGSSLQSDLTSSWASTRANRETCIFPFRETPGFATRTAVIVRDCRLSQMHLSVFSCIPSQVFEVSCGDPACSWVAITDGPISDRSGLFHSFSSLCLSPAEMKGAVLALRGTKSKKTPLWPGSRGAGGTQREASSSFQVQRSLSPPEADHCRLQ